METQKNNSLLFKIVALSACILFFSFALFGVLFADTNDPNPPGPSPLPPNPNLKTPLPPPTTSSHQTCINGAHVVVRDFGTHQTVTTFNGAGDKASVSLHTNNQAGSL